MAAEQLVLMFHNDIFYSFERAEEHTGFIFGGPLEERFSGMPSGERPLHMLARLPLGQLPQLWPRPHPELRLMFGFNYSGLIIKYKIKPSGWIEILELDPGESSEDFPYRHYPQLLPYVPLRVSEARRCTYLEFADYIPNMVEDQPAELVVAVPPPATLGVSLWGPTGDASDVTVVFECSIADRMVKAYTRFIT